MGRDGEVVSVKPGRARNHLVPGKMAAYASPERLAEAEMKRASWEAEEAAETGDDVAIKVSVNFFSFPLLFPFGFFLFFLSGHQAKECRHINPFPRVPAPPFLSDSDGDMTTL